MTAPENLPEDFTTIPHTDESFDGKSVYLTGQSFIRCSFRSCTLIIKELSAIGLFQDCTFENCVWHLDMTISDRDAWQGFLNGVAPAITAFLPQPAD